MSRARFFSERCGPSIGPSARDRADCADAGAAATKPKRPAPETPQALFTVVHVAVSSLFRRPARPAAVGCRLTEPRHAVNTGLAAKYCETFDPEGKLLYFPPASYGFGSRSFPFARASGIGQSMSTTPLLWRLSNDRVPSDPELAVTRAASAEDLKEACVVEALAMVARGPECLSLREVARRLGVPHHWPYKHFPTRDHLLAEIARRAFDHFSRVGRPPAQSRSRRISSPWAGPTPIWDASFPLLLQTDVLRAADRSRGSSRYDPQQEPCLSRLCGEGLGADIRGPRSAALSEGSL